MSNEENVKQDNQQVRGDRGVVGTPTPGLTMKQRHAATGRGLSLKVFARELAKAGDKTAQAWLDNKKGASNQGRNDANIKKALESRTATKAAKRKKKGDNSKKSD
jgi:hypothetical protein